MDKTNSCSLLALCLAISGVGSCLYSTKVTAQVYQWEDEKGVVHYSDKPISGAKQLKLIEINKQANNSDGLSQIQRNKQWFQQQRKSKKPNKAKPRKQASVSKQQQKCSKLNNKLADLKDKYRAKKRRGIRYSEAANIEMAIELQENKIKREC